MSAAPQSVAPSAVATPANGTRLAAAPRRAVPASRSVRWVRLGIVAVAATALGALAVVKHRFYLYDDIDLAMFVQALERVLHGSTFVSIRGMSWLGDHASYVLFLLAPIYAIARHPATPLVMQSIWLAAGAIPVHRMATRALAGPAGAPTGPGAASWAIMAAYLLQPALGYLGLFEFHPEFVATTALLFAFDALGEGRTRAGLAWAGLALLAREDVALVVAAFGLWGLLFRRPRAVAVNLALIAGALATLAVTLLLIRPHFTSAAAQYGAMYRSLGESPGDIVANILRDPLHAIQRLVTTPGNPLDSRLKVALIPQLLLPLALLPLLAPATLLVALPVFAEHLLSGRLQQHTIVFHYSALLLPVLAWGALEGVRRLAGREGRGLRRATIAAFAMLVCAAGAQVAFGPLSPFGLGQERRAVERVLPDSRDRIVAPVRDAMLQRVPATGGVVAGFEFLSRLASRDNVHSLHHVLAGTYTYSSAAYPEPEHVSAVLADWSHRRLRAYLGSPVAGRRIGRVIERNGLVPVEAQGDLVLFAHGERSLPLVEPSAALDAAPALARIDGVLEFLGAQLGDHVDPGSGCVPLITAWRRAAPLDAVYLMRLDVVDAAGRVVSTHTRVLGYVVWPVADWAPGAAVTESYALEPGVCLAPGRYALRMGIARLGADTPAHIESLEPTAFELGGFSVGASAR